MSNSNVKPTPGYKIKTLVESNKALKSINSKLLEALKHALKSCGGQDEFYHKTNTLIAKSEKEIS